ncbi:MAG TPA: hypothetical protein VEL31_10760, partial [Ktedonobacteraceae bacterium]|nr:hypothetical protein [Ktedonobacteraceae bacterium]
RVRYDDVFKTTGSHRRSSRGAGLRFAVGASLAGAQAGRHSTFLAVSGICCFHSEADNFRYNK